MKRGSLEAKIVVQKDQRVAVVNLSGAIGLPYGFHGHDFIESLTDVGEYDVLYGILDSTGGSPVDSWTIFNFLRQQPQQKRFSSLVLIVGECSGDAVLIALGFDQILMRPEAHMGFQPAKLRKPSGTRQATKFIARLIAQRAECGAEEVLAWMDKNRRFTAEECLACGLCDAIV